VDLRAAAHGDVVRKVFPRLLSLHPAFYM